MVNYMEKEKIKVEEQIIEVSEIRIKNTIKEYRSGIPFTGFLSASFASTISFLTAFAAFFYSTSFWKWVFLTLLIISFISLIVFGILSLKRFKTMKGTEKWFLDELKGLTHEKEEKKKFDGLSIKAKKRLFYIINIVVIIGVLLSTFLIALGLNNWNIKSIDALFWAIYLVFGGAYLVFGTYINALLAYIFFGYDDGFPGSSF